MRRLYGTLLQSINSEIYRDTIIGPDNSTSKWLAGLRIDNFPGANVGVKISNAAASIGAGILSPEAIVESGIDPSDPSYIPFTAVKDMIQRSHYLGMEVKPWTVSESDRLNQSFLAEHFLLDKSN